MNSSVPNFLAMIFTILNLIFLITGNFNIYVSIATIFFCVLTIIFYNIENKTIGLPIINLIL